MRNVTKYYLAATGLLAVIFLIGSSAEAYGQTPAKDETTPPKQTEAVTAVDSVIKAAFNERVNEYLQVHRNAEAGLPPLSTEATAEQIGAHKAALLAAVKEARKGSKRGDIFTKDAEAMFKRIIREMYSDAELIELRKDIVEAENKGVPVKVNAAYPEGKEKPEIPARLLLALPELPKELQYRFVGKNLLLVDKHSSLILDHMGDVLP
jgi:hypothetical protein